jgi:hypothetical protein
MTRSLGFLIAGIVLLGPGIGDSMAAPRSAGPQQLTADNSVGEPLVGATIPAASKALHDTARDPRGFASTTLRLDAEGFAATRKMVLLQ